MSDENKVQIEFGGGVNPSYDTSVERVRKGLRETAAEYGHFAKAVVEHLAVTATAHTIFEHRTSLSSAAFTVFRVVATRALGAVAPAAAGAVGGLSLVLVSVRLVSGAIHLLERASNTAMVGLGKFSLLEDLTARLRSFTGSAEGARLKLGELVATFRGTPVAVPDAVDAYRSARAADSGSGELSGAKGLTLLGDVAAGSGNKINDVAGAVGSLYADLQDGQPIQDAANKLRDMGVISGETRAMLDRLLASGKSGPEVWAALRVELEKSTGAMKEQEQTLSSLQQSVQRAKDQLYTSFAEGSVPYQKDKLGAEAAIYQKLQPGAQELGDVYGGAKSAVSDLIKKLLDLIGIKAASDKALGNSAGIKTLADAYVLARVALATFGVVAIPILAVVAYGAGALTLAVVGAAAALSAFVAVAFAAAGGLFIYKLHMDKANEARLAFLKGTDDLVGGLRKQADQMVTVADKARLLAQAYGALKSARDGLANAKTPEEKEDYKTRIGAIQAEIKRYERVDDAALKPSEARSKTEAETAEYDRSKLSDEQKAKLLEDEALQANFDAQKKSARANELAQQNTPAGRAAIKDENYKAGLQQLTEQARAEAEAAELNFRKKYDTAREARKKVTDAADKTAKDGKTATDKAAKEGREERVGLAEADAEARLAALQTEGIQRARDEYEIRRALLETRLREAEAEGDAVKLARLKADYYRDAQAMAKKEDENTKANAEAQRALNDQIAARRDSADRRELDRRFKKGEIDESTYRKGQSALAGREENRFNAEAAAKEQEARDAQAKGDQERALRLATEAQQLRARADAKKDEAATLLDPAKPHAVVADSLAKLGLGGNTGPGDAAAREARETNRLLKDIHTAIKDGTKDPRRPDDRTARFGR